MPMFDYKASQIEEFSALIEELAQYEADIENAKQHRDKNLRKRAEQDSKDVRQKLLSQVDPSTIFLFAAGTNVVNSDALRSEWQPQASNVTVRDFLRGWSLESFFNNVWKNLEPDLTILPRYSLAISFQFRLAQPYLSKDDDAFYIIDNPVRKDKVFKTPMVAPSSWKGSLCHALWQMGHRHDGKEHTDEQVKRMFGETRDDDTGQSGRLFFYPSFFDRMGLEIINPHDRVRRVGKNPILFESVPAGATGRFTLLYVPFDRIGKDEAETRRQVAADLTLLAEGLQAMFTLYGFGAKTSSGFGLVDPQSVTGKLQVNILMDPPEETKGPNETLVRGLLMNDPLRHRLHDEFFVDSQFVMVPDNEIRNQPWKGRAKADYKKVKPRIEELLAQQPSGPTFLTRILVNLDKLSDLAQELAQEIRGDA